MTAVWSDNLLAERKTFVSHLECSMTGERYEADQVHGLSRAGRPLLVRYDLDGARAELSREAIAARPADMWRLREILPVRRAENIVSLGEAATPIVPLGRTGSSSRYRHRSGLRWARTSRESASRTAVRS